MNYIHILYLIPFFLFAADDQSSVVSFQLTQALHKINGLAISSSGEHIAYVSTCEKTVRRTCFQCDGIYCIHDNTSEKNPFRSVPSALAPTESTLALVTVTHNASPKIKVSMLHQTEGTIINHAPQLTGPIAFSPNNKLLAAGIGNKTNAGTGEIGLWQIPTSSSRKSINTGLRLVLNHSPHQNILHIAPCANEHLCFDTTNKFIASTRAVFNHFTSGS